MCRCRAVAAPSSWSPTCHAPLLQPQLSLRVFFHTYMHPPKTPLWCPGTLEGGEAVAQQSGKGACEGGVDHSACFLAVTPAHPSVRGGQAPRTHGTFAEFHGAAAGRCLGFVFSFFVSDSVLFCKQEHTAPQGQALLCGSSRARSGAALVHVGPKLRCHAFTLTFNETSTSVYPGAASGSRAGAPVHEQACAPRSHLHAACLFFLLCICLLWTFTTQASLRRATPAVAGSLDGGWKCLGLSPKLSHKCKCLSRQAVQHIHHSGGLPLQAELLDEQGPVLRIS